METLSNNILISVIVPIFNVEDYLEECITSILLQSYANLEIILIDDGSTDKSGHIAEKFAQRDKRCAVFHKTNGGASDARNFGISRANGDYFLFVDSDDVIDENLCECLLELATSHGADISVSEVNIFWGNCNRIKSNTSVTRLFTPAEAQECMGYRRGFGVSCGGKLFSKRIIGFLSFPVGKKWEDLMTTPYLIEKANKVAFTNNTHYYWRMTKGSITHSAITELDLELFARLEEYFKYFSGKYPELINAFICRYCNDGFNFVIHRLVFDKNYKKSIKRIKKRCTPYWKMGIRCKDISMSMRLQIAIMLVGTDLYRMVWKFHVFWGSRF